MISHLWCKKCALVRQSNGALGPCLRQTTLLFTSITPPPAPNVALSDGSSALTVEMPPRRSPILEYLSRTPTPLEQAHRLSLGHTAVWRRALSATKQVVREEGGGGDHDRRGGGAAWDQASPGEGHRDHPRGKLDYLTKSCLFFSLSL